MKSVPWTTEEILTLHRLYPVQKMEEIQLEIPRHSAAGIQTKARDLGIRKTNEGRTKCMVGCRRDVRYWTPEEDEKLRQAWATLSIREVYKSFEGQRGKRSIQYRVEYLKLKRPPELVSQVRREVSKKGAAARVQQMREKKVQRDAEKAIREAEADAQHEKSLQPVRVVVPAAKACSVSLSSVLRHPIEAAWRGVL